MLKRLLVLTLLAALLLGLVPALAASPTAELTALAQYFPFDAPAYAALRTGEDTIAELDKLLATVLAKLPPAVPVPENFSLQFALDSLAQEAGTADFATGIRSWLGDYAAIGLTMQDDPTTAASEGTLLVAQLTDRAAAEAFWKAILDRSGSGGPNYKVVEGDAFTLFAIQSDPPIDGGLLFTDDVMLLGVENLQTLLVTRNAKLAQNDTFQQTLALLPASQYSGLVYLNVPALANDTPDSQMAAALLGPQALGFTLLDERSLVLDVASKLGDTSVLAGQGVTLPALSPVNPAFAAYLPADASLVAHASSLAAVYDSLLATARATAGQNGQSPDDFEKGINQLKFAVRGFTGLDLEADILSWMTGDFALFASIDSTAVSRLLEQVMSNRTPMIETLPFSAGLVVEATDTAKAQALVAGLSKALTQLTAQNQDITLSTETIGGAAVTVLSAPLEVQPGFKVPFEVVIGANDAVFVIATRDAAAAILEGQPGLSTDAAFAEAGRYLLPDATSIWYMDNDGFSFFTGFMTMGLLGPAIGNVFESIVADLETGAVSTLTPEQIQQQQDAALRRQQEQLEQARSLYVFLNSVLNSGTISTTSVDGSTLSRFVLTLAE